MTRIAVRPPSVGVAGVSSVNTRTGDVTGLAEASDLANKANILTPTAIKTGPYTASPSDYVPVDTTNGAVTIRLPTAPVDKTVIGVKMIAQGGTYAVTVAAGGTDIFNIAGGTATRTLSLLGQAILIQYQHSTGIWFVEADDLPLGQLDARYASTTDARLSDTRTPSAGSIVNAMVASGAEIDESKIANLSTDLTTLTSAIAPVKLNRFFAKDYGVTADGTTDDTTNLQACWDAAGTAKGEVVLPYGNIKTTASIKTYSNVYVSGAGKFFSTLVPTGADFTAIVGRTTVGGSTAFSSGTHATNIQMREFGIDGAAVTTAGYNSSNLKGVFIQYIDNCLFQNLYIRNTGATGLGIDHLQNAVITGNTADSCGRLALRTVTDAVTNATTTVTSATAAFTSTDAGRRISGTRIAPNTFISSVTNGTTIVLSQVATGSGSGGSITMRGAGGSGIGIGTSASTEGVIVANNISTNNANYGVFFESQGGVPGGPSFRGNKVLGNYTTGNYVGIGDSGCYGLVIEANTSVADTFGISVDPGTINDGAHGYPGREGMIIGNIVRESVLNGIQDDMASNGLGKYTIKNNVVSFAGQHGIYMRTHNTAVYGVLVNDNVVHNCTQNGILWDYMSSASTGSYNFCQTNRNFVFDNGRGSVSNNAYGIRATANASGSGTVSFVNSEVCQNRCTDRAASGQLQTYGFRYTGSFTGGKICDNDFQGNATGGLAHVTAPSATTALRNNEGYTPAAPATVSVTSSPQTYTAGVNPEWLYINGGNITGLTLGGVAVSTKSHSLPLEPGDAVIVTYVAARTISDGATNTDNTLSSAGATAAFVASDVGQPVSGTGIVAGTTIVEVTSASAVVLSEPTTATAGSVSVTIGAAPTLASRKR